MKRWFSVYKKHFAATLRLAWPVILGQVGHIVIGLVDNGMIGQLGPTELAAAAFANSIFFLVLVLGIGICMGISPVVAQAVGEEDDARAEKYMHMSVRLALLMSVVLMVLTFAASLIVPYLPHENPEVLPLAKHYLQIVNFSTLPVMVFLAYRHYVEGFEWMAPGAIVMGGVVVLNILLNWVMIFGNLGFPEMGLAGGGWATVISRTMGMVLIAFVVAGSKRFRKFRPLYLFGKNDWKSMKEIMDIGLPTGMQLFFEVGAFTGALFMAGLLGKIEQSAHQIALGLAAFAYLTYSGVSAAVSIRVANAFGKKRMADVRKAGFSGFYLGLAFVIVFVTIMIAFRNYLPNPFMKPGETEVLEIASSLLIIGALFQFGDGIQVIALGALRGISDVKIPTWITLTAYWGVGLPLAYVFAFTFELGIWGIWYALTAGLTFSALFLTWRFIRLSHLKRARLVARTSEA